MKCPALLPVLLVALANVSLSANGQASTNSPATLMSSANDPKEAASLEKHAKPIMDALKLEDASKAAKVHELLLQHFAALKAWHEQHDAQLKTLWAQFNKARAGQDQTKADQVMAEIDSVYSAFKPQHDRLLSQLGPLLATEQIEQIKDTLTVDKVKVTFNAYGEIFHGLTDAQKAFILTNLKAAREEAIDAGSMQEKSAFFKKYKIKIEAYLTAQGYDVKQAYKEFVAKQKADMAAKKAGSGATAQPSNAEEAP